jgi:phosphohistidine phosphatase SixA
MEWEGTIKTPRWPAWLNAAALLVLSWIVIASISLRARAGAEIVAVAFPPWWGSREAISAAASADAAIVRTTAIPTLLVVRPLEHDGMARLRQAGAWLAMDPQAIDACFSK